MDADRAQKPGRPGDVTFDRTTALGVLVMELFEHLVKQGVIDREKFALAMSSAAEVFKKDQPAGAHLIEAVRDGVLEQVRGDKK
jgi:hypothetical protein